MALWKDIVAHWDDESRNTALKEIIRDRAEKHVTQEELEAFYNDIVSTMQSDLAQQVYNVAHKVYLSECSKIVCKVGRLI